MQTGCMTLPLQKKKAYTLFFAIFVINSEKTFSKVGKTQMGD